MAEEFAHAGIGIDFKFDGLEKLKEIQESIDKMISKAKEFTEVTKKFDMSTESTNKFNNSIKKTTDSVKQSAKEIGAMSPEVKKVTDNVKSMTSKFDTNSKAVKYSVEQTQKLNNTVGSIKNNKIDEVRKSFQQASDTTKKFNETTKKVTPEPVKKFNKHVKETENSTHRLKDTMIGTFAGNLIYSGIQSLTFGIKGLFKVGQEYNKEQDTMKTVWKSLTEAVPKDGKNIVSFINDMANHSIYAASTIDEMAQSFYHVHSNEKETKNWTKDFVNLGSTLQISNKALAESGTQFAKIMAGGKANSEDMNVMINRFPMFGEALTHVTGKSMKQLYQLSAQGKLTAGVFSDAITYLGKKYKNGSIEAMKSYNGMSMYIKQRSHVLAGAIGDSSFKMSKSALKAIQSLLSENMLKKYAKAISSAMGSAMTAFVKMIEYINKNKKAITGIMGSLVDIGKTIGGTIFKTAGDILKTIAGIFGLLSGNSKKAKNPLETINTVLKNIAKHKTAIENLTKAFTALFMYKKAKLFGSAIADLTKPLGSLISKLDGGKKHVYAFFSLFSKSRKSGNGIFKSIGNGLSKTIKMFHKDKWLGLKKVIDLVRISIKGLFSAFKANPFNFIITGIGLVVTGFTLLYKHSKKFRKFINGLISWAKKFYKQFSKWFSKTFKKVEKALKPFIKFMTKQMKKLWSDVKSIFKSGWNVIKDILRIFKDVFTGNFKDLGKVIPKLIKDLWKLVKSVFKGAYDWIDTQTGGFISKVVKGFQNFGKTIGNFFVGLWKGIKQKTADGINGIIKIINVGIKGIDWVISKFGGSKQSIKAIDYVHFAKGTGAMGNKRNPINKNTMAMLNDGHDSPSTGNREMAILPNGKTFMPRERNWTGMLPAGTEVLNATETKMLMAVQGIQKYAKGTGLLGNMWNGTKKVAGNIWDGTKKVAGKVWNGAKTAANVIAHPIKVIKSAFSGKNKVGGIFTDMTSGIISKITNLAVSFFKKHFGSMGNPAGADMGRWKSVIKRAAGYMNVNLGGGDMNLILRRIQRESGGSPTIAQKVDDVNSRAGHPAQGLLQYVPATFANWAVKGHQNIRNGFDQILAMFNDSNWRSDIANNGGWGPSGHRARKNGGPVTANQVYRVNEEGFEMFKPKTDGKIINHRDSKNILNKNNKPIAIDNRTTINVKDGSQSSLDSISDLLNDHDKSLFDKLAEFNDEGGIII